MIPPDVANSLRQILPDLHAATNERIQSVLPAQQIADILSNLAPGQRVLAEIQALLPNGSYRAIIAQRDITLALPFSAKAGDSVELEVVETDGKHSLAFVTNRSARTAQGTAQESVSTSLSQTGKLIGELLGGIDNQGKRAPPAPLNGSQPLVQSMPKLASDLAPVLKQALAQSGMFYEAHQARWVAGELPTAKLLQEPQGQHSQPRTLSAQQLPATLAHASSLTETVPPESPPGMHTTKIAPPSFGIQVNTREVPATAQNQPDTSQPQASRTIPEIPQRAAVAEPETTHPEPRTTPENRALNAYQQQAAHAREQPESAPSRTGPSSPISPPAVTPPAAQPTIASAPEKTPQPQGSWAESSPPERQPSLKSHALNAYSQQASLVTGQFEAPPAQPSTNTVSVPSSMQPASPPPTQFPTGGAENTSPEHQPSLESHALNAYSQQMSLTTEQLKAPPGQAIQTGVPAQPSANATPSPVISETAPQAPEGHTENAPWGRPLSAEDRALSTNSQQAPSTEPFESAPPHTEQKASIATPATNTTSSQPSGVPPQTTLPRTPTEVPSPVQHLPMERGTTPTTDQPELASVRTEQQGTATPSAALSSQRPAISAAPEPPPAPAPTSDGAQSARPAPGNGLANAGPLPSSTATGQAEPSLAQSLPPGTLAPQTAPSSTSQQPAPQAFGGTNPGNPPTPPISPSPGGEVRPQAHSGNPDTTSEVGKSSGASGQQEIPSARIEQSTSRGAPPNPQTVLPPDLAPLVQQQLDALATQTFAWQGQIWPGQQMYWEIDEQQGRQGKNSSEAGGQWETRLKLKLPLLGDIEASLHLRPGNEIGISLSVKQDSSGALLESASQLLRQQFEAAGLNLTQFSVKNDAPPQ